MTGARIRFFARWSISLGLMGVLVARVDWHAFGLALGDARLSTLSLAFLTVWTAVLLRSISYDLLVNRDRRLLPVSTCVALTLIGNGAALVLPSGTGDLVKAHLAYRSHGNAEHLIAATVVDKLTSLLAVALIALPASLMSDQPIIGAIAIVLGLAAGIPIIWPAIIPWKSLIRLVALGATAQPHAIKKSIDFSMSRLLMVLGVSIAGWLTSFYAIHLVAISMSTPLPFSTVVAAASIMTVASLVPISLAGIGLGQVTLVAALVATGFDAQGASHIALLHLALVLTPAGAGALMFALRRTPQPLQRHKRPERVTMLSTVYPRTPDDFTGHFVAALAEAMAAKGIQVCAWSPHAPGLEIDQEQNGVRVRRFRYLPGSLEALGYTEGGLPAALRARPLLIVQLPSFVLGLARAARTASRSSDLIHAHWGPTGLIASLAAPSARVALTLHGTDVSLAERSLMWRRLLFGALRRCEPIIVVSPELERRILALPRCPVLTTHVLPNGVDDKLLSRDTRDDPSGRPVILYVGRLTESKGVGDLLAAFNQLNPDATLRLVGVGPLDNEVRRMMDSGASIELRDVLPHDQALDEIARAHVVVVPSRSEGFSLVTLEAAAMGIPVIGSSVGAIPEILGDEGTLTQPGDSVALAAALSYILVDMPAARRTAQARRIRLHGYSWSSVAERTLSAYSPASDIAHEEDES